ncbi:MAG: transglutaminase domain-containing protein [Candidatus Micrarchaeota archaeon]
MKYILFFLFFCTFCFSDFGRSTLLLERSWTITGDSNDFIDFQGALAVNNSHQRVTSIEIEPVGNYFTDKSGTIWVNYIGPMNDSKLIITAKTTLDIDYDTELFFDPLPPNTSLVSTNLTAANSAIKSQAQSLRDENSSLNTILRLTNWVNSYVQYDESYWDDTNSATDVLKQKKGVCVQYTHLFISLARSLGFETRFVSGYVLADSWQPHTWVEVYLPEYGYLPVDPTFGQIGVLDNSHAALSYGDDQLSSYDVLLSRNQNVALEVNDTVQFASSSFRLDGIEQSIFFDPSSYLVDVIITNNRMEYLFGAYSFTTSPEFGTFDSSLILLQPNQSTHRYYGLNHSYFDDSYSYSIPVSSSFNDVVSKKNLLVDGRSPVCILPFVLLFLLYLKTLPG